jgi:hypothetical protein
MIDPKYCAKHLHSEIVPEFIAHLPTVPESRFDFIS